MNCLPIQTAVEPRGNILKIKNRSPFERKSSLKKGQTLIERDRTCVDSRKDKRKTLSSGKRYPSFVNQRGIVIEKWMKAITMGLLGMLVEELNLSFSSEYSKEELDVKIICCLECLAKCSFEKLAKASAWVPPSLR